MKARSMIKGEELKVPERVTVEVTGLALFSMTELVEAETVTMGLATTMSMTEMATSKLD